MAKLIEGISAPKYWCGPLSGNYADAILADVCRHFEETVRGTVAGVTILDRTAQVFHHAVFPSLSDEYGGGTSGHRGRR